jgi:hypothetical protein
MTLRLLPRRGSRARRRIIAGAALALALTALYVDPRAVHSASHPAAPVAARAAIPRPVAAAKARPELDRAQTKTVTLLTDSVTLGAATALRAALPGRHLQVLGKPALMVDQAAARYLPAGRRVGSVVVVGLGYNSLWERNRVHFSTWASQFDRQADALLAELRARGAKKIVWVTLRDPAPSVVTRSGLYQYAHYAWFFPYVNARLQALARRQSDVSLADWAAVSDRAGLTYDLIHLDPAGAQLMAHVIARAVNA